MHEGWQLTGTGLGGSLGDAGARLLLDALPMPGHDGALPIVTPALGLALLSTGAIALGLTWREMWSIARWMGGWLIVATGAVGGRARQVGGRALATGRDKVREATSRPRESQTMAPAEVTESAWRS